MRQFIVLFIALVFVFSSKAQDQDSITTLVPYIQGWGFYLKDTSRTDLDKYQRGSVTGIYNANKYFNIHRYRAMVYNMDSVIYYKVVTGPVLPKEVKYAIENLGEKEVVELSDIYIIKERTPPAIPLRKRLLILNENKKIVTHVMSDSVVKGKIDSLGRQDGIWRTALNVNGKIIFDEEGSYKADKKVGIWETYDRGHLIEKTYYTNDSVRSKERFFPNGRIQSRVNFLWFDTFGKYTVYYENGNAKSEGNYARLKDHKETVQILIDEWDPYFMIDTTIWVYKSVKDGEWVYYTDRGKLMRKEFYKIGELVRKEEY